MRTHFAFANKRICTCICKNWTRTFDLFNFHTLNGKEEGKESSFKQASLSFSFHQIWLKEPKKGKVRAAM